MKKCSLKKGLKTLKQFEFLFSKVSEDNLNAWIANQKNFLLPLMQTMKHKTYLSIQIDSDSNDPTYTLIYDSVNTGDKPEYNIVDVNDANLEGRIPQSDCK